MLGRLLLFISTLTIAGSASAAGIDLSKPWGDKYGCINKDGQEEYAEKMLLLTEESIVMAASACSITDKSVNKDGSLTLKADCQAEGEESPTSATFTVKVSPKNKKKLIVTDETGFVMGEVSRCK